MCRYLRTIIFFNNLMLILNLVLTAPTIEKTERNPAKSYIKNPKSEVERSLEQFLNVYYDEFVQKEEKHSIPDNDIYETMQGDQPAESSNFPIVERNITDMEYVRAMRNRSREHWIQILKENILRQIGRDNSTVIPKPDARLSSLNVSDIIPGFFNSTITFNDDQVGEKIRSFYPSCEVPLNTDQDIWKDDDVMNLYFNFDHSADTRNTNIATATLRLYRLPENSTKFNSRSADCDTSNPIEDERLLRVSIYWYTKSLKKRRVKRRLSDSKVIQENARWVDLSVKPATKAWSKGRNLGLGVLVEDQEGNTLRADRYFKGASCMVGTSTPKPIPTIIMDAARKTNELNRIHNLFGRNSTSALHSDIQLLPTIDICTLEFPDNYTQPSHIANLRVNACNLKKIHEQGQLLAEKERLERLATLPDFLVPNARHIRHQRQHLANKKAEDRAFDPRSSIVGSTVILKNSELTNKFNFSLANR